MAKEFELPKETVERLDKAVPMIAEIETILASMKKLGQPTAEIEAVVGPAKQAIEALNRLRK
jgi:hypothetical protein